MTVKERLIEFLKYKNLSQAKFAKTINVSSGYVNAIRKSIQPDKVNTIAMHFPDLNTGWLLTGEGEMLKNDEKMMKESNIVMISPNTIEIPIVSQYAYAGYLSGFSDPEYIENLPTVPVFVERETKGKYLAFEVRGDSMNDNSYESILDGDVLISREINKDLWGYKLPINKWNFIIVHKVEGILVKRIINHDLEKKEIKIHSLNPFYEDSILSLDDINQLFNVVQIQRKFKI